MAEHNEPPAGLSEKVLDAVREGANKAMYQLEPWEVSPRDVAYLYENLEGRVAKISCILRFGRSATQDLIRDAFDNDYYVRCERDFAKAPNLGDELALELLGTQKELYMGGQEIRRGSPESFHATLTGLVENTSLAPEVREAALNELSHFQHVRQKPAHYFVQSLPPNYLHPPA